MKLQDSKIKMDILYVQYFIGMHEKRLKSGKTDSSQDLAQDSSNQSTCNNEQQKRKKILCNMHNEIPSEQKNQNVLPITIFPAVLSIRYFPAGSPLRY